MYQIAELADFKHSDFTTPSRIILNKFHGKLYKSVVAASGRNWLKVGCWEKLQLDSDHFSRGSACANTKQSRTSTKQPHSVVQIVQRGVDIKDLRRSYIWKGRHHKIDTDTREPYMMCSVCGHRFATLRFGVGGSRVWAYLVARTLVLIRSPLTIWSVCHLQFLSYLAGSKSVSTCPADPDRMQTWNCAKNINFLFIWNITRYHK